MKAEDIKGYTPTELEQMIREHKEELANLKFANRVTPVENPARLRQIRKDIARMLTELNAKTANAAVEATEPQTVAAA